MLRSRRLAFAAAALILGLSACGDAKSTTIGAKAPAVIHVGSNGGKLAAGATADRSMMPYMGIVTYVFDGQFPDLGTTGSAWSLPVGQQPDLARILAVARTLGVQGDVRTLPVDQGGGWAVGPNDGTGPSLNVANDGLLSWWYNGMSSPTSVGCAKSEPSSGGVVAVSPPPDSTVVVDPCQPTPAPANVPDKATALAKAKDLMASVGVNAADYDFTAYADQYSASVTGFLQVGGHRSSLQTNVGFGAEGAVMWASGLLATPQPAADYPLVSGDIALQRLNDPSGRWMFFGGPRPMNGVGIAGDSITNSAGGGSTPTVGAPDPVTGSASVGSSGAIVAPMPPATVVCEVTADCNSVPPSYVPPAPVTVHLNAARLDLTMLWAQDGTVWLLPAYTFTTTDGGEYTVIAVEESFLDIPKPVTPDTNPPADPPPTTTLYTPGPDTVPSSPDPNLKPIDPATVATTLVGLGIDEAKLAAERNGWTIRVSTLDGIAQPLTADYSPTRANLSVAAGMVVAVDSIG